VVAERVDAKTYRKNYKARLNDTIYAWLIDNVAEAAS
jgi:hypothetical protein